MTGAASASLWDWALMAYDRPGVSEACLHLQDALACNVPLMLWSAWMAATGRRLDDETIEAACDAARAWDGVAVAPLRHIRRTLKGPIPDIDDVAREALRQRIKAVELDAERPLLADLEALSDAPVGPPAPTLDGLVAVARVWSRVVPRPALIGLAERLPT